jgi:hypothetical protein
MTEPPSRPTHDDARARAEGARRLSARRPGPSPEVAVVAALLLVGVLVTVTVVPSIFTLDEFNYLTTVLALRAGGVHLPGTAGLTPSLELFAFDPAPTGRVPAVPVASVAPPLYAFLALPVSYLGWRGLVLLNTVSFLVTGFLVFRLARRAASPRSAALALVAFLFGGFCLEYAQGAWPQMLAVALCTGAFAAATWEGSGRRAVLVPALGGVLAGLAVGVRYQNLVFAGAVGLVAWSARRDRVRAAGAYVAGLAVPLAVASLVNHARLGSFNPVSKGPGYLQVGVGGGATGGGGWAEPIRVTLAKVVDYSLHPPTSGWAPDATTGAYLAFGAVKKALLQSSPWFAAALLAMALAWRAPLRRAEEPRARVLRALSVPVAAVLALFAQQGYLRTDGLGFNQRYLLELLPLGAAALAIGLDGAGLSARPLGVGAVVGAVVGALALASPVPLRHTLLLRAPLLLAAGALLGAVLLRRRAALPVGGALVGASIAWAAVVHVGDDLAASRALRSFNQERLDDVDALVPEGAAVFAVAHWKDPYALLALDRGVLVVDPSLDGGKDSAVLARELRGRGRRVLVDVSELPPVAFERLRGTLGSRAIEPRASRLVELFDGTR